MPRTPVHWTVSRNIVLIHGLSHDVENENAQMIFVFFFYKILFNSYLIASTH